MKVNEQELLLTIEATLTDFLPLPETLESVHSTFATGRMCEWKHGDELSLQQAWKVIREPDYPDTWLIVPLHGGRVVLAALEATTSRQQAAGRMWQDRAVGVLALAWGSERADA